MLGWLLAGGFGAGLALRAAGFLGTPAATDQNGPATSALVVPPPYFWAAGICLILVAANVIVFVYLLARWRAIRRDLIPQVEKAYERLSPPAAAASDSVAVDQAVTSTERADAKRLRSVAGTWAWAALTTTRVVCWAGCSPARPCCWSPARRPTYGGAPPGRRPGSPGSPQAGAMRSALRPWG